MNERGRRWRWWGLAAGLAVGIGDYALTVSLGADFRIGGRDLTVLVLEGMLLGFAAFGWFLGRLVEERATARRHAATIERQLRELEAAQRVLVEREKLAAVGRMAAGIAHEVRNPLAVIRSSAAMLRDEFAAGSEEAKACGFICEEIDRLDRLVGSVLDWAKPTRLDLRELHAHQLLERCERLVAAELERRRIELAVEVDPSVSTLIGDPDLLEQAIYGLLLNAAEAIGERGRIGIVVREVGADSSSLAIEIADDGHGVDAHLRDEIFEPFVTTRAQGSGLGLPMVRRAVEDHGGTVELVELVERGAMDGGGPARRGACFRITLPRLEPREIVAGHGERIAS
ncbi:MAG TPA: ATP-binding protein [Thermoanaerobaculia bacterium]|nr:ATP-binding protein [Thermoanaerobaculia bacterium]